MIFLNRIGPSYVIKQKNFFSNVKIDKNMTLEEAIKSKPTVVVEFFASWCPHCQRMMPIVEQIRELLDGKVDIYQLDIEENEQAAKASGAQSVPTFIVFRDGREVWRQSGEMDADYLLGHIEKYV